MIRAYKFFPTPLVKRVEKIRSEKFGIKKKKYMDSIEAKLDELIKDINKKDISVADQKSIKAKIDDMKTFKSEIEKISNDKCGPIMDVLCWNDGTEWCCVVDTTNINKYYNCEDMYVNSEVSVDEKTDDTDSDAKMDSYCYINNNGERINDISILTPMINYKKSLKYGTLSDIDLLNYCINIYDDGNIVSIVVPSSSHGSHVAGIIGAYYKDDITRNGMAPGCQMVSIKIGDTRLGTMETNQALMRALNYVKEYKCDLVNMSYGEPSTFPSGAFPNEVDRLVWKYGTIFISSAGNDGPCLSTAGAPQSATNSIVGIGAMFTPNMIKTEYGLCDIPNMDAYTWTSRGPTLDGALGVKICAPGGAISPIPTYNLSKSQLMNGTSMASPNACGNVALLLGILKDKKIKYTPNGIETALINSASNAGIETIAQGYGLIQTNKAYKYCVSNPDIINFNGRYNISVDGVNHTGNRGIYIRDVFSADTMSFTISITPKFHENVTSNDKVNFEINCLLKSKASWIKTAQYIVLPNNGKTFHVNVTPPKRKSNDNDYYFNNDNSNLNSNDTPIFVSEIVGIDSKNVNQGPIFRIPVVVCSYIDYDDRKEAICKRIDVFKEATIKRVFHKVPYWASYASLVINIYVF